MLVSERALRQRRIIRVPPIPPTYAMTDRMTGMIYYLKISPTSPATLHMASASELSALDAKTAVVYPADNEPMITSTQRIYINNGEVLVETTKPNGVNSQPLLIKALSNDLQWWLVGIANNAVTLTSEPSS